MTHQYIHHNVLKNIQHRKHKPNTMLRWNVSWWKLLLMTMSVHTWISTVHTNSTLQLDSGQTVHTCRKMLYVLVTVPLLLPPTPLTRSWLLCYLFLKPSGDWGGEWPLDSKGKLVEVIEAVIDPPHKHLQCLVQVLYWEHSQSTELLSREPGPQGTTDQHTPTVTSEKTACIGFKN